MTHDAYAWTARRIAEKVEDELNGLNLNAQQVLDRAVELVTGDTMVTEWNAVEHAAGRIAEKIEDEVVSMSDTEINMVVDLVQTRIA